MLPHTPEVAGLPDAARDLLLRWYRRRRRALPWRESADPYRVWVSEIMLQQTQVETVVPYFLRFLARFPDLAALAGAPTGDVLKAWEGLGYYSRARNLQRAASLVLTRHQGLVPRTVEALRELPGIGPYTAAAIASICFGVREPVVDGNVLRVFTRFWAMDEDVRSPAVRGAIEARLRRAMRRVRPADFNQAIMELGALVCRPRSPSCGRCALRHACAARAAGTVDQYPVSRAARAVRRRHMAVGWVESGGRTLAVRRAEGQMLGGLWMFPSVDVSGLPAGDVRSALRAAILDQTGCRVRVGLRLGSVSHAYSHFTLQADIYACRAEASGAGDPRRDDVRWVSRAERARLPCSVLERKIAALCTPRDAGQLR
jgi:A/G-specific adenine glycosylase